MLNATLCATGRAICCLLETYQEHDGVRVPDVLIPFMGGITFLPFIRDAKIFKDVKPNVVAPSVSSSSSTTSSTATSTSSLAAVEQITNKLDSITLPTPPTLSSSSLVSSVTNENKPTKPMKPTTTTTTTNKSDKKVGIEKKGDLEAKKVVEVEAGVGKKIDVSQPPAVPILPPMYTTPAPSMKKVSLIS